MFIAFFKLAAEVLLLRLSHLTCKAGFQDAVAKIRTCVGFSPSCRRDDAADRPQPGIPS